MSCDSCQPCACCSGVDVTAVEDERIAEFGVTFTGVFAGDDGAPGFVYSTGLSEKGLADLIFVGDCSAPAMRYLVDLAQIAVDENREVTGFVDAFEMAQGNGFNMPMWIVPADGKLATHALGVARRLERVGAPVTEARLQQVVMPDAQGRFPWEPGYAWIEQLATDVPSADLPRHSTPEGAAMRAEFAQEMANRGAAH